VGENEATSSERQILTFPVTITISTPSPVAPLAPVVGGSNLVSLGARAEIVQGMTVSMGSGGLQTQPDALLNETWSRGTAALNDRVKVRGTLHAKTRTNGANVSVTTWDQNPAFDPVQTLSWKVTYPSGPANPVTVNAGESTTLEPGKYGVVTLNSQSTVTLKTGTYYLTSFSFNSAATIKLDQARGPIVIYVTDNLPLRGTFTPLSGTNPDLLIAYLGTVPVVVEMLFNGAVLAPSTSLTLRSITGGTHQGFFYAKDMILDAGARVKYRAPNAIIGTSKPTGSVCRQLATSGGIPPSDLYRYCKCGFPVDSDQDDYEDCVDGCKFDPLKVDPGACGCGRPDTDTDGDKTPNCLDPCDIDPNNVTPGQCGCLSSNPVVKKPMPVGTICTNRGCPSSTGLTCAANGVCGNPSACNPGGCQLVESNQSAYWFCPGPVTQSAAATACRNRQMALVRIEGFLENDYLKQFVTKPVWIGANSITTSGVWRWSRPTDNNGDQFWQGAVTGSQRNSLFSFWAKTAPASQRCAVMQPGDARWIDVDCNQARGFVCEFRTPVTPPTITTYPPNGSGPAPVATPIGPSCKTSQDAFLPPPGPGEPFDAKDEPNDLGINRFVADQEAAKTMNFQGAAQSPPNHNTGNCNEPLALPAGISDVADATGRGCRFDQITVPDEYNCNEDKDCVDSFGPGLQCRQVKVGQCDPTTGASPTLCSLKPRCGRVVCPPIQIQADDPNQTIDACQTIEVCDPGSEFTGTLDENTLIATPFNPAGVFGGTNPVVQPSVAYEDTPEMGITGKDHKWCFMDAQHDIPDADQVPDNKVGQSNGGSKISFSFDPNVTFSAKANLLSLGETDLDVNARASLTTTLILDDFLEQDYTGDILSAVADIRAHRCTISTKDTSFSVFGLDFVDLAGVPMFDTSDENHDCLNPDADGSCEGKFRFKPLTDKCEATLGKFITISNRAKKAFRDVQQLMEQFKVLKAASPGGTLLDLCQQVVETVGDLGGDVPGFPDGLSCPENESAETTINRFLDYYQAPGTGQISQLRDAVRDVAAATNAFFDGLSQHYEFGPEPKSESKTLVEAQFQIGPVPCVLEIAAFYSYGVHGFFDVGLKPPFNPFDDVDESKPQRNPIATVKAGVAPFANAGLSAFVGAGKSLGPFSATLGIEGRVSLADVRAPIFAGAGIGAEVQVDKRSLAPELEQTLGAVGLEDIPTHLGVPKAFKFFVWYEYGAAITVDKLLSGEVNGRLRIKFAFFSRTWRKRLVKFNGLPSFTINIVNGKLGNDPNIGQDTGQVDFLGVDKKPASETATVEAGTADMGLSESQVPLLALEPLPTPVESVEPDSSSDVFHPELVQAMFYDNLCCSKQGEECLKDGERAERFSGKAPCCPGSVCKPDPQNKFVCSVDCSEPGESCQSINDCCFAGGFTTTCQNNECVRCGFVPSNGTGGGPCTDRSECCDAQNDSRIQCEAGQCTLTCPPAGMACTVNQQCCFQKNHECSTSTQQCCGRTRFFANPAPPGGFCTQNTDCCGFEQPNSGISCIDNECVQGPT
jgi:hypothetical protein